MPYSVTCKENMNAHYTIFNLTPRKQNKCILSGVRISMLNVLLLVIITVVCLTTGL
jgi:hypothetical protein